jgi:imidazolonepropionase-like amidohydrolase/ketosteroid isomerase-like protein
MLTSLLALCAVLTPEPLEAPLLLHGGRIVRTLETPERAADVLIANGRIAAIAAPGALDVTDDTKRIDISGKWLMPGLVDAHVHFFQSGGLYTRPDAVDLRAKRPYDDELARIRSELDDTFARWLRCGVTSVIDVGGPFWNFKVRDRARATSKAPRVLVAGPLISTYQPAAFAIEDPPIVRCDSIDDALALVRRQVEHETDLIKIWYIVFRGQDPNEHRELVRATIEESHKHGVRVAVHATQLETARISVEEGADILVHGVDDHEVDEAFIELLLERRTIYVPTLIVSEGYGRVLSGGAVPEPVEVAFGSPDVIGTWFDQERWIQAGLAQRRSTRETSPISMANLQRLFDAGVTIAAGTDAGNIGTLHGPSIFRELRRMQDSGLSPLEVLHTATSGGASALGLADELGTIEEGRRADLLVLDADPSQDLSALQGLHAVVREGRLFAAADLVEETPKDVVRRLLNARNTGDEEALALLLADDVRLERAGEKPLVGSSAVHAALLESARVLVKERYERSGDFVEQHEEALTPDGPVELRVRYDVRDGQVHRIVVEG